MGPSQSSVAGAAAFGVWLMVALLRPDIVPRRQRCRVGVKTTSLDRSGMGGASCGVADGAAHGYRRSAVVRVPQARGGDLAPFLEDVYLAVQLMDLDGVPAGAIGHAIEVVACGDHAARPAHPLASTRIERTDTLPKRPATQLLRATDKRPPWTPYYIRAYGVTRYPV